MNGIIKAGCFINVDAGEGAAGNPLDLALLDHVDAINIALGGHAGDPLWSRELANLATAAGKRVHLHPGYPDRAGFGRRPMSIAWSELAKSLSSQRAVLPKACTCKFHGAIYNQATRDADFAKQLGQWCQREGIIEVVTPDQSCLADAANELGINVLREAFADRRYALIDGRLSLQPRSEPAAVIESVTDAVQQAGRIINQSEVPIAGGGSVASITCDTICIHGDGPNAVELARQLAAM